MQHMHSSIKTWMISLLKCTTTRYWVWNIPSIILFAQCTLPVCVDKIMWICSKIPGMSTKLIVSDPSVPHAPVMWGQIFILTWHVFVVMASFCNGLTAKLVIRNKEPGYQNVFDKHSMWTMLVTCVSLSCFCYHLVTFKTNRSSEHESVSPLPNQQ